MKKRRVLVLLPSSASPFRGWRGLLLRELGKDWELDLLAVAPGRAAGFLSQASGAEYAAAVVVGENWPLQILEGMKCPLVRASFGRSAPCAEHIFSDVWNFSPGRRPRLTKRLLKLAAARRAPATALTSLIIPCFNQWKYTRQCLDSVLACTRKPYEIIIVDNGSTDGTAAQAKKIPGVRLIRNPENLGFAKAINQGMEKAKGRYLVWLNSDVVVTAGWLEGLIACATRLPRIAAAGPCTNETVGFQLVPGAGYQGLKELPLFAQAWALKHQGQALSVPRLTGFCLLLKREAVAKVGLLDERFGRGCYEEYDYCLRLRQAGYELACAQDVFVHHFGHKSFGSFEAMAAQARANRDVFLDKWCRKSLSFLDELDPEAAQKASAP
ncbi:MAG: glycosyltransferase family 2 protein [Elusimicrobia bacterium]|nr:glycosyltransferase family 2 protein [Elusimicrobiota bacterium]